MDFSFIGYYIYHIGSNKFRGKLEFYEAGGEKIEARINVREGDNWKQVGIVPEEKIYLEGESLSNKIKRFAEERGLGKQPESLPDIEFSDLSLEEKKGLIGRIHPEGPYQLNVTHITLSEVNRILFSTSFS